LSETFGLALRESNTTMLRHLCIMGVSNTTIMDVELPNSGALV
jgi:hypothetical protein